MAINSSETRTTTRKAVILAFPSSPPRARALTAIAMWCARHLYRFSDWVSSNAEIVMMELEDIHNRNRRWR